MERLISRKSKNAQIGQVCTISTQIKTSAEIDKIITVKLHGKGIHKSQATNLQLGATQYYIRKSGQLIYGKQNFHNGAIGLVPEGFNNSITSKDIPSFDIDVNICNPIYLLTQLLQPKYYKDAESLTTGTGSKRLKEDVFLSMGITLPPIDEQKNIASVITSLQLKSKNEESVLNLFKKQKQFLLSQMFI